MRSVAISRNLWLGINDRSFSTIPYAFNHQSQFKNAIFRRPNRKWSRARNTRPGRSRFAFLKPLLGVSGVAIGAYVIYDPDTSYFLANGLRRSFWSFAVAALLIVRYKRFFLQNPKETLGYDEYGLPYCDEDYNTKISAIHKDCAAILLWLCSKHGGCYIKAGQFVSSLSYGVPIEFRSVLSVLQDRAPFTSITEIAKVIKAEFGIDSIDEVFSSFSDSPVAAASLAQVHEATLASTGETVAVKVQYPNVALDAKVDLWVFSILAKLIPFVLDISSLNWMVTEFRKVLDKECNFREEALQSERARTDFQGRLGTDFWIPPVNMPLCTRRVITMEFVKGIKINDRERAEKEYGIGQRERTQIVKTLSEVFAQMIFVHSWVHCDAHAGNLMLRKDPETERLQVVLLDHGLYRDLSPEFRESFCELWIGLLTLDEEMVTKASERLNAGVLGKLFPLIFTSRVTTNQPLEAKITVTEKRKLFGEYFPNADEEFSMSSILNHMEAVPRELLMVLRALNLLQGLQKSLGGDNMIRFRANAKYAVKGLYKEKWDKPGYVPITYLRYWRDQVRVRWSVYVVGRVVSWWWRLKAMWGKNGRSGLLDMPFEM